MGRLSLGDNGLWKVHEYIRLGSSRNTKPPCEGEHLAGKVIEVKNESLD